MVQDEFEYIEFLLAEGKQDNTSYSYGRYLEAISYHLETPINRTTVSSKEDVKKLLSSLSNTDLAQTYKNNCGTALRAYLRFLENELPEFTSPDEIENPELYVEGTKRKITVNAYERDREARNKCIEMKGTNCAVCDMNFEKVYGQIGIGFIHVHHVKPLHTIQESYKVNPETDLEPVCPNCHAMLHRSSQEITIKQLKEMLSGQGSI